MKITLLLLVLVSALSCNLVVAQVTTSAPPPNRQLQPTTPSQPQSPGVHPETVAGTIEGFVYWNTNAVKHVPAASCSGLAITVSVAQSSDSPFTVYKPIGTLSNNFKYVGQVKAFLAGGGITVYDVCTYGYNKLPVGPQLQVNLTVTQTGAFSPTATPQFQNLGPITIINGQCNMLPRIVDPTFSDLGAHWGSCQNMAYNVNFSMLPPQSTQSGSNGTLQRPAISRVEPNSTGTQQPLLPNSGQKTMLSGSQAGTIPSPAAPPSTQSTANPGPQQMGIMPTDQPDANNQRSSSGKQLTNSDVVHMVQSGIPDSVIINSIQSATRQFDFSPAGTQALQQAHVSPAVLAAMCDGSVRSCPQGLPGSNTSGATVSTPAQVSPGAQVSLNPQPIPPGQVNPGAQVSLNPQPLPPGQRMTNTDVAKMVNAGLAESVIISSIQSSQKGFDFSPAGCRALQQAHVSAGILAAMADGSVRPCPQITGNTNLAPGGTAALNPHSVPPRSKDGKTGAVLTPIRLPAPTALRKVQNPRLAQQNASIIAVLEQQKQGASQDTVAMKSFAGARSASVVRPTAVTLQTNRAPQNLTPETVQSDQSNLSDRMTHVLPFNSLALTCTNDPTPRILQLNGGQTRGVFTPEAKYNLYTITGCSFGQSDPGNSAYIFGPNGFKANLNIDFWSENGITAHLDPWLAGVSDQDNVTLVVAPKNVQEINQSGYKFYAARGMPGPGGSDLEVQLAYDSMPQSKLNVLNGPKYLVGFDALPENATSKFPSFSFDGTPVMGWVFRYAYGHRDETLPSADCFINEVPYNDPDFCKQAFEGAGPWNPHPDTWDLGQLATGFAVSSYQLYYENTDAEQLCNAWEGSSHNGQVIGSNWDFNLDQNRVVVNWPGYVCFQDEGSPLNIRNNVTAQSSYGVAVWVLGPRCVDPWTGQKDQACTVQLQKMLS